MNPIGQVERDNTDVKDKNALSRIVLDMGLTQALTGLDEFSHIFVLFWLHEISEDQRTKLMTHPRGRKDLPLVGVYSTRTPSGRNPIGLTLVELVEIRGNVLTVMGLDAFDGTPILDIKPYDNWDSALEIRLPEWWKLL